jgi:hypothetical protein
MGACYSVDINDLKDLEYIPGFKDHVNNLQIEYATHQRNNYCCSRPINMRTYIYTDPFIGQKEYKDKYILLQQNIIDYLKKEFPDQTKKSNIFETFDFVTREMTYDIDTWFKYYSNKYKTIIGPESVISDYKSDSKPDFKSESKSKIVNESHILYIVYRQLLKEKIQSV